MAAHVEADSHHPARPRRAREHSVAIVQRGREGLLDEHVLAGLQCREGDLRVLRRRHAHRDHLDFGVCEQCLPVAQAGRDPEPGGDRRDTCRVDVCGGDDSGVGDVAQRRQVQLGRGEPTADDTDPQRDVVR
jgi:hypothetical protein